MVRLLVFFLTLPVCAVLLPPWLGASGQRAVDCGAQEDRPPSREVRVKFESGEVQNTGDAPAVVFRGVIRVPGAQWLRLRFAEAVLSGDPASDNASYLRITSVKDSAVQVLNAEHLEQWVMTSA